VVEAACNVRWTRRRRAAIGGLAAAASLGLHLLLWSLLASAPELQQRARTAGAAPMRWLTARLLPTPDAPAATVPQRATAREAPRARAPRRARAVAVAVTPLPIGLVPAAAAPVPIDGSVFALPRIGYGEATRAAGVRGFASAAPRAIAAPFNPHDALRRQIAEHIGRQLGALSPSPDDGRCTAAAGDDTQLLCDSDRLSAALGEQAAPLARLLAAYRRSAPGGDAPALESRDGRYRLSAP
jgi:hypothetical protein